MKITFLLSSLDMSGGIRVLATYANMLAADGHEVFAVVPAPRPIPWKRQVRNLLRTGRPNGVAPRHRSHFDSMPLQVHELESHRPVVDADVPDADVLIATWWETAEWAIRLSASKGAKVYLIQHHETFENMPAARVKATYRLPFHKVVVCDWLLDLMRDEYKDDSVDLVCNAVDHRMFHAPARARQPVPTVGFMYSVAEYKSTPVAVSALRKLKAALPVLKVISFGMNAPQGMEFMGPDLEFHLSPDQSVIRECYSRCDVWLTSSRSEGFNLPALEAMACRTPVVATRTGWPWKAVVDGANGYLADVNDDESLYRGLQKVLRSPDWETMSSNAYNTAKPLTWDDAYRQLLESLHHACRRAQRGEIAGRAMERVVARSAQQPAASSVSPS